VSKHTSGPWSIDWNVSRLDIYGGDERTVVASIRRSTLSEGIDSAARSNGRLISAAPDLLEAGNKVLNYATLDGILSDESRHADSVFAIRLGDLRELRAAIAKAEGRA